MIEKIFVVMLIHVRANERHLSMEGGWGVKSFSEKNNPS